MPPVGQKRTLAYGPYRALSMAVPPTTSAGNSLSVSMPYSNASCTSLGVATPGMSGMFALSPALASALCKPGLMANAAPASATAFSCFSLITVPAPTIAPFTSFLIRRMASKPAGVRSVISSVRMPPSTKACAKSTAVDKSSIAITGTTGLAVRISRGVSLDMMLPLWRVGKRRFYPHCARASGQPENRRLQRS